MDIDVPQDRNSSFEPKIVKKRQKDISDIDQKIISMYAKGMTTKQISETMQDIYGFEASEGFISDVTDKILPQIEEWQNRPLSAVYPIIFIDAIHFSVREDSIVHKVAAYVVLGINTEGKKEILSLVIGENESSKYWLTVLNSLKKPWCPGHSDPLLGRTLRDQGGDHNCLPGDGAAALHRPYGAKHAEICGKQRHERIRQRSENSLYGGR